jgi:hypothetical protein
MPGEMSSLPPGAERDLADLMAAQARFEVEVRRALSHAGIEFPAPPTVPVPPMRAEEKSSHNWAELADKAASAVKEGLRRDDTTPEEMVRKVIADEEARRSEAKELARLRAEEAERVARLAKVREERRRMVLSVAKTVLGGLATAGAFEVVRYLLTLHH